MHPHATLILGAGPAGLTAAEELSRRGGHACVIEQLPAVGGIARTEQYRGYRFDIGGHRFYTKVTEIQQLWQEALATEFIQTPRLSRIHYRGRFFHYPLEPVNALVNLGPIESARIMASYVHRRLRPLPVEETFEQWVTNRFGDRLYRTFFKTYTEKVWGIPCTEIRADWAAQRIRGLSLTTAITNAVFGRGEAKTLIKTFDYPRLGPGQMWERFEQRLVAAGHEVWRETEAMRLRHENRQVRAVIARRGAETVELTARHFLSSLPLAELIERLDPLPPDDVRAAARQLRYRDFLIVGLILDQPRLFPDNWIYIHTPGVRVGRIQNFKNWSAALVPDPATTSLGLEYFCNAGDDLWRQSDAALIALATRELAALNLAPAGHVRDGVVIRQPKAYPVYDATYRQNLDVVRAYLGTFTNLQTIGRNGLHRYNNQDHSMLTGLLAVRNLFGERHNLWEVNTERSYQEEFQTGPRR